jgi:hypothetical protein
MRYIVTDEPKDNVQYVVGITVDRARHVVALRWLDIAPI